MDEVENYIFLLWRCFPSAPFYTILADSGELNSRSSQDPEPDTSGKRKRTCSGDYTKSGVRSDTSFLLGWPRERHENLGVFGWSSLRLLAAALVETATGAQFEGCARVPRQCMQLYMRSVEVKSSLSKRL
jgi:hypothetical protein